MRHSFGPFAVFHFCLPGKAAVAELQKYKAQAEIETQNKALVYRWADVISTRKSVDVIDEYIFTDYIWHLAGEDIRGIEKVKESFKQSFSNCPDFRLIAEDVVAKGDKVVVRWSMQGTNKETGKKYLGVGITIDRIANGRFVEG